VLALDLCAKYLIFCECNLIWSG